MTHEQRVKGSNFVNMLERLVRKQPLPKSKAKYPVDKWISLKADGFRIRDIATLYNVSESTVSVHLRKAKTTCSTGNTASGAKENKLSSL